MERMEIEKMLHLWFNLNRDFCARVQILRDKQASPLYSHKGSFTGATPMTPIGVPFCRGFRGVP